MEISAGIRCQLLFSDLWWKAFWIHLFQKMSAYLQSNLHLCFSARFFWWCEVARAVTRELFKDFSTEDLFRLVFANILTGLVLMNLTLALWYSFNMNVQEDLSCSCIWCLRWISTKKQQVFLRALCLEKCKFLLMDFLRSVSCVGGTM